MFDPKSSEKTSSCSEQVHSKNFVKSRGVVFGRDETLGIYIWIVENQNEKILPIVPLNNKSLSLGTWIEFEDDELRNYKVIDHLFETIVKGERLQILAPTTCPSKFSEKIVGKMMFDISQCIWSPVFGRISGCWPKNYPRDQFVNVWVLRQCDSLVLNRWTLLDTDSDKFRLTSFALLKKIPSLHCLVGLLVHKIDNTSVIFTEEGNICLAGLQMNSEIGDKIGFNQWTLNTEFMMLNVATSLILLEQHIAIPTLFEECETGTMHNFTISFDEDEPIHQRIKEFLTEDEKKKLSVANSASLKFSLVDGINLTWALLSTSSNNESKENSDVEYKKHEQHSKTGITVNSNEFNNSEGPYQISSVGNEKLLNEQNSIAKTCKDEEYFSTEEMNIRLRAYSEETGSKSESFVTVVESIESDSNILSKNAKNIQPTSLEDSVDFPEPTTGQTNEEFQKHDHSQSVKTEKVEYTLPPTNTPKYSVTSDSTTDMDNTAEAEPDKDLHLAVLLRIHKNGVYFFTPDFPTFQLFRITFNEAADEKYVPIMNLGWWYRLSIRDVFLEDEKQPGPPIVTLDAFVRAKDPIKTELSASSDVMIRTTINPIRRTPTGYWTCNTPVIKNVIDVDCKLDRHFFTQKDTLKAWCVARNYEYQGFAWKIASLSIKYHEHEPKNLESNDVIGKKQLRSFHSNKENIESA